MLVIAQSDPAWEYWDTSTYFAIALVIAIATVSAWLVFRRWKNSKSQNQRRAS